jgi:hypothetical protein
MALTPEEAFLVRDARSLIAISQTNLSSGIIFAVNDSPPNLSRGNASSHPTPSSTQPLLKSASYDRDLGPFSGVLTADGTTLISFDRFDC